MSDDKDKKGIILDNVNPTPQDIQDSFNTAILKNAGGGHISELVQHAMGSANKRRKIPRLALTENPLHKDHYAGVYKLKRKLLPDSVIKTIRTSNLLVAAILRARGNSISMFGHIRKDRHDLGIDVILKEEFTKVIEPEQMVKIQERIDRTLKILVNCGYTEDLEEREKTTLPEFMDVQTRNALSFGRFATEIIYSDDDNKEFHRFRATDAGTIYPSVKEGEAAESVRRSSIKLIQDMTGVKIDTDILEKDQYDWIQVVEGFPRQAFTPEELIVYNMYPSTDVEHNGFPVTPLDTVINAVTTHTSIEVYNKLYFQNGRAAKGMLVIQSDEIDQSVIDDVKQQFNASINNVENSFRVPIFGVSKEDNVEWIDTVANKKDGEFEYLFDQTTRNILSAFNMSPDELPGFTHLSRGTNQQALSEANNEWKLTAARDTGIRPLINHWENFLNNKIFPLIDPELSQLCDVVLAGFDAETREKEGQRIQTDMPIHMNYDDVLEEVDKEQVGPSISGTIPFNEFYRAAIDTYNTVGEVESTFLDNPGAIMDPMLQYKRDQFFFQWVELLAEYNPNALQAYFAGMDGESKKEIMDMYLQDYLEENDVNN
jgi:hypothetical protein